MATIYTFYCQDANANVKCLLINIKYSIIVVNNCGHIIQCKIQFMNPPATYILFHSVIVHCNKLGTFLVTKHVTVDISFVVTSSIWIIINVEKMLT